MHVLKNISHWLAVFLLSLVLLLALTVLPNTLHLTSRETVINWVTNPEVLAGVQEAIPDLLTQGLQGDQEAGLTQISERTAGVDIDKLAEAGSQVLTSDYLRQKMTPVVDGIYDWLEGKTDKPQFDIILSDRVTALVDSVKGPLKSELELLPTCPSNITYDNDFNPLDTPCLPSGVDVDEIVSEFSKQVTSGNEGLTDIHLSSDELNLSDQTLETAPRVYGAVNNLPLALIAIMVLLSVAVIFSAKSVLRGINRVAWILAGNGALMAVGYWILSRVFPTFNFSGSGGDSGSLAIEKVAVPLTKVIVGDVAHTGLILSLAAMAIGAVLWLSGFTYHKIAHESPTSPEKAVNDPGQTKSKPDVHKSD